MLVNAIREACLQILKEEGPDQLTTQRLADVAGINIASLYQYFPNKEAVLAEVFEEQIKQHTESARPRIHEIDKLSRISFEGTLEAIVEMEIEQRLLLHKMDPAFFRVYQHSFDIHRRVNELTVSLNNPSWDQWFPEFLALHADKLRTQDFDLLGQIARHALSGVLLSTMLEQPERLEQPAFQEELLTLLLNYLKK